MPVALNRGGGAKACRLRLIALADARGASDIFGVAPVENATAATRTQPTLISLASLFTMCAANAVSVSKVSARWSLQKSPSMIDVDSSITKTISAHGWQGSVVVVELVVLVVVVVVVDVVVLVVVLVAVDVVVIVVVVVVVVVVNVVVVKAPCTPTLSLSGS